MRKIEKEMLQAIKSKLNWSKNNTSVTQRSEYEKEKARVYLFGNHIGDYWYQTGKFETNRQTLLDWPSATTISRLRALDVNVKQRNWKLYIDDELVSDRLRFDHLEGIYKQRELLL